MMFFNYWYKAKFTQTDKRNFTVKIHALQTSQFMGNQF